MSHLTLQKLANASGGFVCFVGIRIYENNYLLYHIINWDNSYNIVITYTYINIVHYVIINKFLLY